MVAYGERSCHRIVAVPSFDNGKTWRGDRLITILENPAYCGGLDSPGDFSYTTMAKAGRDKYLFIYYAYPGDPASPHRGIYGTYVPAEALRP